jgi:hypothetical protein
MESQNSFFYNLNKWFKISNPVHCFTSKNRIQKLDSQLNSMDPTNVEYYKFALKKYSCVNKGLEALCKENGVKDYLGYSIIPRPFRFGGFCIVNMGVAYVLLKNPIFPIFSFVSAPARMLFYNLLNRIYCVNLDYFNRAPTKYDLNKFQSQENVSSFNKIKPFLPSFLCAVVGSCSIGYLMERKLAGFREASRLSALSTSSGSLPFFLKNNVLRMGLPPSIALATGHFCDLFFSRFYEIYDGALLYYRNEEGKLLPVLNTDNQQVRSKVAGSTAVFSTFLQRASTAAFVLMLNALIMNQIQKISYLSTNKRLLLPCQLLSCGLSCYIGLPITQAYVGPETLQIGNWICKDEQLSEEMNSIECFEFYRGH